MVIFDNELCVFLENSFPQCFSSPFSLKDELTIYIELREKIMQKNRVSLLDFKILDGFCKSLAEVMILKVMTFIFKSRVLRKENVSVFIFLFQVLSLYIKKQWKIQNMSL